MIGETRREKKEIRDIFVMDVVIDLYNRVIFRHNGGMFEKGEEYSVRHIGVKKWLRYRSSILNEAFRL